MVGYELQKGVPSLLHSLLVRVNEAGRLVVDVVLGQNLIDVRDDVLVELQMHL